MKIFRKVFLITITLLIVFSNLLCVNAASASLKISGTSTVRSGDTLTLTVSITGQNIKGVLFDVEYDASKLTYSSFSPSVSGWEIDENKSTGLIKYVGVSGNGISGTKNFIKITFKVKSLSEGQEIKVTARSIELSDGNSDISASNSVYSVKIAPPLSSDATLSSLSIDGFELNEKFSSSKTSYTATVDIDTTKVTVNAKANDSKAEISIRDNTGFKEGKNTVTVKVTAEDGTVKRYIITVTRPEDPNKEKNNDSSIARMSTSMGELSPPFSPNVHHYVVYLPYEADHIDIASSPTNQVATVEQIEGELKVGNNKFSIVCTAEDGSTTEYFVTVVRMEEYKGAEIPNVPKDTETDVVDTGDDTTGLTDEQTSFDTQIPEDTETEPAVETEGDVNTQVSLIQTPIALWIVVLVGIGALLFGALCGWIVFKK